MTTPEVVVTGAGSRSGRWRDLKEAFARTRRTLALGRSIRLRDLRSGHWFDRLATLFLNQHEAERTLRERTFPDEELPERGEAVIRRSAWQAAVMGSGTAALSTGAIVFTSDTGGYGGLLALPIAALGIGGDMVSRALMHLQMTAEIADLYKVRFSTDDPAELPRLLALAFGVEDHQTEEPQETSGRLLIERISELRGYEIGAAIGATLLAESVLRNIIPFVGVPVSAVGSWRLTHRVGRTVHDYVRYRSTLDELLPQFDTDSFDVLTEGIWFVLTSEAQLSHAGAALLAHLLQSRNPELREELNSRFMKDPSMWLDRLKGMPREVRPRLMRALEAVAAIETPVPESRIAMLRRAADLLEQELDETRVHQLIH